MSSHPIPEIDFELNHAPPGEIPAASVGSALPTAHDALFSGQIEGLIVALAENEFPLLGTAAWIDWLLRGSVSDFHRDGVVLGKEGEITYLPVQHRERTLHLLLVGVGSSSAPAARAPLGAPSTARRPLDATTGARIAAALKSLRVGRWGLSRSDFPGTADEILTTLSQAADDLAVFD